MMICIERTGMVRPRGLVRAAPPQLPLLEGAAVGRGLTGEYFQTTAL